MSPEEKKTLALLLKKQGEEQAGTPVLRLISGGGEPNKMADKLLEFAGMARRGELFDYAVIGVLADSPNKFTAAWGSDVPTLQICAAVGATWHALSGALQKT